MAVSQSLEQYLTCRTMNTGGISKQPSFYGIEKGSKEVVSMSHRQQGSEPWFCSLLYCFCVPTVRSDFLRHIFLPPLRGFAVFLGL